MNYLHWRVMKRVFSIDEKRRGTYTWGCRGYRHIGTWVRSCRYMVRPYGRYMGTAIKVHGYGHAGTWVRSCRDMGTVHGTLRGYGVRYVGGVRWAQTYTVLGDVTCVHLYSTLRSMGRFRV